MDATETKRQLGGTKDLPSASVSCLVSRACISVSSTPAQADQPGSGLEVVCILRSVVHIAMEVLSDYI